MLKKDERLRGICPILPTPFLESGAVDYESLENLVEFMLAAGVSGIALFGNASEAFALTQSEKVEIARVVTKTAGGRVPLVFGSGSTGLECAVENSLWAQASGADILMVMPPHMIKPDNQRLYDYYAAIARAVDIPIMIQDAPNACGVPVPVDMIVKLYREFENIQYLKEEAPPTFVKMQKVQEAAGDGLVIFGGLNGVSFYEELCYGAAGSMPAGEFPDALIRIYELFINGDRDGAREEYRKYLPFMKMGATGGGLAMSVHKAILKKGGVIRCDRVRNPFVQADEKLIAQAMDSLSGLDLLAFHWSELCRK